ncbi:virulence RhuM family protein [Sorangium sp. So ce394]|uniref:virulence RhuM family protein n=1 Tax=Sorangium sp. So ce394 TaxID=3133310 RepID=UPI003F5CA890
MRLENETVWVNQRQLTDLFGKAKGTISEHIKHIFEDGELDPGATVRSYRTVQLEGGREVARDVEHYNLDVVIALGFRVRSAAAVRFRQWAAERLKEYIVKGFVLDDDRLKRTDRAADYFDELLARIREIRASEARIYQRIREIFALASDYDESDQATLRFFAFMQNKMHYAATGLTAAEIVRRRADAEKPNMGLTSWSGGRVLKRDVGTAKNYLDAKEIDTLNRIVVMFLDRAEFRAQRRRDIRMSDWEADLDKFLADTELPVLVGAGSVSHDDAFEWAGAQYDAFAERRRVAAETEASARYLDDLTTTAKLLEGGVAKPAPKPRRPRGSKKGGP